jgi:hypothetical protein
MQKPVIYALHQVEECSAQAMICALHPVEEC